MVSSSTLKLTSHRFSNYTKMSAIMSMCVGLVLFEVITLGKPHQQQPMRASMGQRGVWKLERWESNGA